MSERIEQALSRLFERHRIVFWYDAKRELREAFEGLSLSGIAKVEIANNEFGLKYRLLREEPAGRFLLYHDGPRPADLENWLLDVLLAHGEFRTDQGALWLAELGLDLAFLPVIEAHPEFFQATRRREALLRLVQPADTPGALRLKLLAICANAEPRLDAILESLLADEVLQRPERFKLIERCGLLPELWRLCAAQFGYSSQAPGLQDFSLTLFKSCYDLGTGGAGMLTGDALAFLKRWKDSRQHEEVFEVLSLQAADALGIEADLNARDFRDVLDLDLFRLIDRKIISELVRGLTNRTLARPEVVQWARHRRFSHWYRLEQHLYVAIEHAAMFLQALDEATLQMTSLADGVERYTQSWFRLDQHYRKFTRHVARAAQLTLLGALVDQLEGLYANNVLLTLGDRWQPCIDAAKTWDAYPVPRQRQFWSQHVYPYVQKAIKVAVIVSDALRYEIADELQTRIRQEDRYEAELSAMLGELPSYTQLGMAALLPHHTLTLDEQEGGLVLADGQPTSGLANRDRLLANALGGRAKAIKAEELLSLGRDASRELVKDVDVLYLYHNRIDAMGDKRDTEARVFEAVDDTLDDLVSLLKKLAGANISHMLVTADHGFLYQQRELEESDFADLPVKGDPLLLRNRRFVLGKGLAPHSALLHFSATALKLGGAVEVQLPKSIHRLRVQGSGSRFVHGGATLQEVVVPVLRVNKGRQSDTSQVDVEILRGASSVITTGQLAVTLFQAQPVSDKVQPRTLRAGLYNLAGALISDEHDLVFDRGSENPREREMSVRFVLTKQADASNGQEVELRLREQGTGTTHFRTYKSQRYTMRSSFSRDFDF
jgi:uncharacterized protein (TIGR02687 family)